MSSEVDICNLALTHIRAQPDVISIDPPEGGVKAEQCALYYATARRVVLRSHPWSFATTYRALGELDRDPVKSWLYCFAVPFDCLRAIHVFSEGSETPQPFERAVTSDGTQVIYCNVELPTLKYVRDIVDPTVFDAHFVMALSWYMASLLAMPISGDAGLADRAFKSYLAHIAQAAAASAHETAPTPTHTVPWMTVR